ncbi:MAG: hypothetical protein U0V49_10435 [Saprospiraceae bacterium]
MKCFRTLNLRVLAFALLAFASSCRKEEPVVNSPNLDLSDHSLLRNWYTLCLELGPKCNGFAEPVMARSMSYFSMLMHESLYRGIPGMSSYRNSADGFRFSFPSPDQSLEYNWAIVANEAAQVYVENVFGSANEANARARKVHDDMQHHFASQLDSVMLSNSAAYGKLLAFAVLRFAETDGMNEAYLDLYPQSYSIPKSEGLWIPTTPDYTPRVLLPYWGACRPVLNVDTNVTLFNKELVYSNLSTSNMYAEAVEVYNRTKAISETEKEDAAYFNRDMGANAQPLYHNFLLALQLMAEKQQSLPQALEMLAKLSYAIHDAYISSYQYNYTRKLLRVSTYARQFIDRTFQPIYKSQPIPEGVSDQAVCYAAAAEILSNFFGYRQAFTDKTQLERPDLRNSSRSFDSFQALAIEASQGDIYTGVHFRTSVENGRKLGTDVARNIMSFIIK